MNEFLKATKNRRSIYSLTNQSAISDAKLKEMIEIAVSNVPSAFNSQTSRVILLTGDSHKKLWNITLNQLKVIVPKEKFDATKQKIESFSVGYGTILYFEEQETIKSLQTNFASYADNFPIWSQQSSGMLQLTIWTALEVEGMGASVQHYNPLIDADVAEAFNLPHSWKLISQMPFGIPYADAGEKTFLPIESRVKVFN